MEKFFAIDYHKDPLSIKFIQAVIKVQNGEYLNITLEEQSILAETIIGDITVLEDTPETSDNEDLIDTNDFAIAILCGKRKRDR